MEPKLKSVEITVHVDGIEVRPVFEEVDRPDNFAWKLKLTHMQLAHRLKKAIVTGAVLPNRCVKHDVYGKSYVGWDLNIIGRRMSADLKRLGY